MSLKDFEIGKELGKGAFGSVCIVKRKIDNKTYAMKRVKISQLSTKDKENSLNEIRILASLSHLNIIGYKEAFFDQPSQTLNIVMEYADDGDIASKIKYNKKHGLLFRENIIWDYLIQILTGLKFLHDNKIMHRDLKSANLFLMKNGTVKIGDLNVSKITKMGMAYTQTGTPYYASPEIWMDKPYDYKSDIWSVGCILYELCMLRPPFTGTSLKSLCMNIQSGIYAPISKFYSRELSYIVKKILEVNPSKRPTCGELLRDDIVIQKMREVGVVNGGEINGGKKAELMKTIKMPRNLKEINKALPMKRYNVKQREEMFENDEYETMKNGFFKDKKENKEIKELLEFFDVNNDNDNQNNNNIYNHRVIDVKPSNQHKHKENIPNKKLVINVELNKNGNNYHQHIYHEYINHNNNPGNHGYYHHSPMNNIMIKKNNNENVNGNNINNHHVHHNQVKTPNKYPHNQIILNKNNIKNNKRIVNNNHNYNNVINNYVIHKQNQNLNKKNSSNNKNNRPLSSINPRPKAKIQPKRIINQVPIDNNQKYNRPYSGNNVVIHHNNLRNYNQGRNIISPLHKPNNDFKLRNGVNIALNNNYLNKNKNRKVIIEKIKYQKPSRIEKAKEYEKERMRNICNNANYYQNQYKQYIKMKK